MKHSIKAFFALATLALLTTAVTQAETHQKLVIALHTDDFSLHETDISELAIGESQTIETDSGKVIDLLRTADGVEIYVDGELLDMDMHFNATRLHAEHLVKKHIEITCDDAENCDENVFILAGDDLESEELHKLHANGNGHKVIIIKKELRIED